MTNRFFHRTTRAPAGSGCRFRPDFHGLFRERPRVPGVQGPAHNSTEASDPNNKEAATIKTTT